MASTGVSGKTPAGCILALLHAATSAHLIHLGTHSLAEHMAMDGLYKALPGLVDALAEAWQGKHGKLLGGWPKGYDPPADDGEEFVEYLIEYLEEARDEFGEETEIQNLVDEIASELDSTLYKLRFLS